MNQTTSITKQAASDPDMKLNLRQFELRLLMWLCFATAVLLVTGCEKYQDFDAFLKEPRPVVTSTEYRMGPPDVIYIYSKQVREVANHTETIRPDGRLTLPLLGSIYVAGKTSEEVSAELQEMAKKYYEDADISVRVIGFNSKKIYVFGEVAAPGPYRYDGANTVLGTLAQAQPTRLAEFNRIQILRPNAKGELIRRMTIDLNQMIQKGDTSKNAVLEEGDVIFIPPNGFATVGLALQQVLLPIQPAAATVKGPSDISEYTTGRTLHGTE